MCFSERASLGAFGIGITCSLLLLIRGVRHRYPLDLFYGWFLIWISLVQLGEFFIWRDLTCSPGNRRASLFVLAVLCLQPLMIGIGAFYCNAIPPNRLLTTLIILVVWTGFNIYVFYRIYRDRIPVCSQRAEDSCRLAWDFFAKVKRYIPYVIWIFVIGYLLSMGYICQGIDVMYPNDLAPFSNKIFMISFILSLLAGVLWQGRYFYTIFGSLWCFMSVFFGIFRLIGW